MAFRTLFRAGVLFTLNTYKTAHPTLLRGVYKARPRSLSEGELPCAWVDQVNALQINHANQIRQQRLEAIVSLATTSPDSEEQADLFDDLVDALMDAFTADFHSASGYSITEQVGYAERLVEEGGVPFPGVDFTIQGTIGEGRQ